MQTQGQALYRLQELDQSIARAHKRLAQIREQLNQHSALQTAQKQVDEAQNQLKPLKTRLRDLELQLQTTRQKQSATEERLYSGAVRNPKELQDMQNEIAALKKRTSELEDQELEQMVLVDEAQSALDQHTQALERVTQEVLQQNAALIKEQETLEQEIAIQERKRPTLETHITPEHLKLYQTLKPQKAHMPIALLKQNSCGVCGIEQTSVVVKAVKESSNLTYCTNCRRILVYMG